MNIFLKNILIFLIIFAITCIIFIPFLSGHYAVDTYNIANLGYKEYAIKYSLIDGRVIMALIGFIAMITHISIEAYVILTLILALIVSNITVIILYSIIKKYKNPSNQFVEIVLICICYITIFNFMYIENMYFVECFVMAISILLYMLAANILVNKRKNYFIKSLILVIAGIMCYQGTICMFIAFLTLFTILNNKNSIKKIIIDLFKGAIICSIGVCINFGFIKVIENIFNIKQNRTGGLNSIIQNLVFISRYMKTLLQNTCDLFPRNLFLVFTLVLTIIIFIYQVKNNNETNKIWYKYLTILFITIAGSNVTFLLTLSSYDSGRLRNALGAFFSLVFILLYIETNLFEQKKIFNIFIYLILFSYLLITIINYEIIMNNCKQINAFEKIEVEKVNNYITQYEKENNLNIEYITCIFINNKKERAYYKRQSPANCIGLYADVSFNGIINFYTGRHLTRIPLTQNIYDRYMEELNGQEERILCIDNILVCIIYLI